MSIRTLGALATMRDRTARGMPVPGGGGLLGVTDALPPTTPAVTGDVPQSFSDVLTAAIPTELLAAYTSLVGIVAGAVGTERYLPFRWAALAVFAVLTPITVLVVYRRKRQPDAPRHMPLAEGVSATLAAVAWGLAMPASPLAVELGGTAETLATASIIIGAATVLGLLCAPVLKTGAAPATVPDPPA